MNILRGHHARNCNSMFRHNQLSTKNHHQFKMSDYAENNIEIERRVFVRKILNMDCLRLSVILFHCQQQHRTNIEIMLVTHLTSDATKHHNRFKI